MPSAATRCMLRMTGATCSIQCMAFSRHIQDCEPHTKGQLTASTVNHMLSRYMCSRLWTHPKLLALVRREKGLPGGCLLVCHGACPVPQVQAGLVVDQVPAFACQWQPSAQHSMQWLHFHALVQTNTVIYRLTAWTPTMPTVIHAVPPRLHVVVWHLLSVPTQQPTAAAPGQ
jgi:hypothetical protein